MTTDYKELASYRSLVERVESRWPDFLTLRAEKLAQQERFDKAPEKVAENIVGSLLTTVLDWQDHDLNWQLGRADLVITHNFVKYMVIEMKYPGSLRNKKLVDSALDQAWRYAQEQRVKQVAVCDGCLFYGADIGNGGLRPRTIFDLTQPIAPHDALWWISLDGVYRSRGFEPDMTFLLDRGFFGNSAASPSASLTDLLHPKYQLPSRCFAYVGDPEKPTTWKLPYLMADGTADLKRLPKAAQALASNYRGSKVGGIPDIAIPDVFRKLGRAATSAGKMPSSGVSVAAIYHQLSGILDQLDAAGK